MEKNAIFAILLSLVVLVGYSLLFPHPSTVPVETGTPAEVVEQAEPASETAKPAEPVKTELPAPAEVVTSAPEKEVLVSTSLYDAVISTRGGVIKSWKLKDYTGDDNAPLDMVVYKGGVLPLTLVPEGVDEKTAGSISYAADKTEISLSESAPEAALTLSYTDSSGRSITKRLDFKDGTYAVGLDVDVSGIAGYTLFMGESFGSLTTKENKGYGHVGFLTLFDGTLKKNDTDDLDEPVEYTGKTGWTAVTDKCFIGALVSDTFVKPVFEKGMSDWGYVGLMSPGDKAEYLVYAGPKDYDRLKSVGHGLDRSVDFGWFSFIAKPVFVALKFFNGLVGNYGWAIIIITFIIKLAFAPLTHKQQKSMKRMQALQPQINALKEKFKGDPQRMNTEMMELYKKEKVNPLGGCLPMVVQIPVFIALYNVLNNAIELRHAPFALWLTDLSAKDPYYILPVVMGASMFLMQKMTPSTMEPTQAKIMTFLPVVMTVMFINLPSGLVLYFTVSNLLSMAQQFYINRSATV